MAKVGLEAFLTFSHRELVFLDRKEDRSLSADSALEPRCNRDTRRDNLTDRHPRVLVGNETEMDDDGC
ncbi:hypothetical protein EYF80_006346 [Liparis tanakae]|uniref:Uncharacterized protein n=1 Tax=Liparis tanakae TaxID=230148 RepID=A0A4Z2IZC6_9TELE|nr:hypothetical protein EYF80_006346 [Liparis tanakae]